MVFWGIYLRSNELSGRLRIISKIALNTLQGMNISPWFSAYLKMMIFQTSPGWDMWISWRVYGIQFPPIFPPPVMELINDGCKGTITISLGTIPRWRKHRPWFQVVLVHSHNLGGGFKYVLFSPRKLGKWSNLTNIFQRGWNHKLVMRLRSGKSRFRLRRSHQPPSRSMGCQQLLKTHTMNGIHPATSPNRKGVFTTINFQEICVFFLGETFSSPHPLLSTGQSLNSRWRQTHHGAIPRKGDQDLQLGPLKNWERDLKNGCLSYLETSVILMILLCFLEIKHQTKICKS